MATRGEDINRDNAQATAGQVRKTRSRSKITRALATAEPGQWMTARGIASLAGLSETTVRLALTELQHAGRVVQIGRGTRFPRYRMKD
jgi:DNA-binding GntR family transcriptional regulator